MLILSAAWQLFDAAVTTLAEALRAAGDTAFTLWARTIIAWGIFTPGAYFSVATSRGRHRRHVVAGVLPGGAGGLPLLALSQRGLAPLRPDRAGV